MSVINVSLPDAEHAQLHFMGQAIQYHAGKDICRFEADWKDLQSSQFNYIYQNFDWVRLAYQTLEASHTPLIISGDFEGEVQFILPLVVEEGLVSTVRWVGKKHANICCGLYKETFLQNTNPMIMREIASVIGSCVAGPAILNLVHQPLQLGSYKNPMMHLPGQYSSSVLFDLNLEKGFAEILNMGNGKRKRKIFRRQTRIAEELGGYELKCNHTASEKSALMEDFYKEKARRFKALGVTDAFAPKDAKDFITGLCNSPADNKIELLRFFELKVGGKTRALYGCAMHYDYCQAWINSVTYDDFAAESPGELVLYLMIERLIQEGFSKLDFGLGAERYKYSWCREHKQLFDVIMPLSWYLKPYALTLILVSRVKSKLRNDQRFWKHVRKIRMILGRFS